MIYETVDHIITFFAGMIFAGLMYQVYKIIKLEIQIYIDTKVLENDIIRLEQLVKMRDKHGTKR
jgi:hypothetical protein